MRIDLDRASASVFAASTDGTVGLEEEFAILDPATLDLVAALRGAARRRRGDRPAAGRVDRRRADLVARSRSAPAAARTSPTRSPASATLRAPAVRPRRRARRRARRDRHAPVGRLPRAAATSTPSTTAASSRGCSTSPGATTPSRCTSTSASATSTARSRVCDRLRPVLPLLLARQRQLAVPRRPGLRAALRAHADLHASSFPRCGVPDAYGSWAAYRDYIDLLVAHELDRRVHAGVVVGAPALLLRHGRGAHLRRPGHRGREPRRSPALIVACVAAGRARRRRGRARSRDPPRRLVEENLWRAIRFGLDGDADRPRRARRSTRRAAVAERLLAWTAPVRAEHGIDVAPARAQRRPAPARAASRRARRCGRSTPRPSRETRARPTPQEVPPHEQPRIPAAPAASRPRRSCAPPTRRSSSASASRTSLVQTVVSLLNLGGRRAGLAPGTEDERDLEQVRLAIEGVRALLPLVEAAARARTRRSCARRCRQLQMAYARLAGGAAAEPGGEPAARRAGAGSAPDPSPGEAPGPGRSTQRPPLGARPVGAGAARPRASAATR